MKITYSDTKNFTKHEFNVVLFNGISNQYKNDIITLFNLSLNDNDELCDKNKEIFIENYGNNFTLSILEIRHNKIELIKKYFNGKNIIIVDENGNEIHLYLAYEFDYITFDNIPKNHLDNLVELLKLNAATPFLSVEIDEYIDNDDENVCLYIYRDRLTLTITNTFIDEINLILAYIKDKKLECSID